MTQYQLHLPHHQTIDLNDSEVRLRHIPGTPFDNTVRSCQPTHIESLMRRIIGPKFDELIAGQEVKHSTVKAERPAR